MKKMARDNWSTIIEPRTAKWNIDLKEIFAYKDLLFLFVKRDFVQEFKQTILGPMWFFIQPALQALTMYLVFYVAGGLSTDGLPAMLFYLSGNILWLYFADCLNKNADTFIYNASTFGKVYFPRLIVPISVVISNGLKLGVRLLLFIVTFIYYYFKGVNLEIASEIWMIIPLILLMAGYGFSLGILFSSLTTKYRDLKFLLKFGVQLLMYASSVVIPLSSIPLEYQNYLRVNPFVNIIETFKYITMGGGELNWFWLGYSTVLLIVVSFVSILLFNKTAKTFMDTV